MRRTSLGRARSGIGGVGFKIFREVKGCQLLERRWMILELALTCGRIRVIFEACGFRKEIDPRRGYEPIGCRKLNDSF